MDYFDLDGLKIYQQVSRNAYKGSSPASDWFYDTRDKLKYLIKLLSEKTGNEYKLVYTEKPNGQAGQGIINFKDYVLVGFSITSEFGDDLFMKVSISNIKERPVFDLNIDLNFKKRSSYFQDRRNHIFNNSYIEWDIDNDFPTNWNGLVELIIEPFETLEIAFKKYLSEIQNSGMDNSQNLNSTINLLKYKKQIILQGPPGTGKTRVAKLITKELISSAISLKPIEYIEWYIAGYKKSSFSREASPQHTLLLKEFQKAFPIDKIVNLSLDDYCRGKGSTTSFCYWIENKLGNLGRFSPGQAGSEVYGVYYNTESNSYKCKNDDPEKTLENIKSVLNTLLSSRGKNYQTAVKIFRQSLVLKILTSYFPDDFFPIFSQKHLKIVANLLDIYIGDLNDIELNKQINDHFKTIRDTTGSEISSYEFMRHLYEKFEIKNDSTSQNDITVVTSLGESKLIQFHPSYSYEDFVRGIVTKPNTEGAGILYKTENKIIAEFALLASRNSAINYVLIIDEINRANLSSVLGELIYALEYRGEAVESMYAIDGNNKLIIPPNLYIIGTMNTADRSVGHIDYAIRRRFAFVDVLPKELLNDNNIIFRKDWFKKISELFIENYDEYISDEKMILKSAPTLSSEFRPEDVWLGHSYFIQKKIQDSDKLEPEDFRIRIDYEIKPILLEYVKDGVLVGEIDKMKIEDYIKSL